MKNLMELLFEGVERSQLDSFIGKLSDGSTLKSVVASENPDLDLSSWKGRVLEILEGAAPRSSSVSLNFDRVEVEGVVIANPLIQVLAHEGNIDLSLSFLDSDFSCGAKDCIEALHHASIALSMVAGARHIIFGYEPAIDRQTRFFTDATRGPLQECW